MIKKITILCILCLTLVSCGSMAKIALGTAKVRSTAKNILNEELSELDVEELNISDELNTYFKSNEGSKYLAQIEKNLGQLEKIKIAALVGSTSEIMNYRFKATFNKAAETQEVRVQKFENKEIVGFYVIPWEDEMKPVK